MKKALIIGAAGFVGRYLTDHILDEGIWSVSVTKMPFETFEKPGVSVYDLDLMDRTAVSGLLNTVRPDYIFHLAAQSSVAVSWKKPDLTVDVNIKGAIHLLDALRELDYKPRVLLIGSGEEYGKVRPEEVPVKESTLPRPGNMYAATKTCQNMIGKIYADAFGLEIMSTRSFNHTGPNQAPLFVVADFCRQTAVLEKAAADYRAAQAAGQAADAPDMTIYTGNLSAKRDFTDVRDVVRAYCRIMEKGQAGETYNVGSGHAVAIQSILDRILSLSTEKIVSKVDPAKLRPVDVPIIEADITKLTETVGWKPEIPLEETIRQTLDYWRNSL